MNNDRDSKKSADIKRRRLKWCFGESRKQFEGFDDDRRVFCNTYDMLMEALDVMEGIDNNFIWVAFNGGFSEEIEMLERIQNYFKNREGENEVETNLDLGR